MSIPDTKTHDWQDISFAQFFVIVDGKTLGPFTAEKDARFHGELYMGCQFMKGRDLDKIGDPLLVSAILELRPMPAKEST